MLELTALETLADQVVEIVTERDNAAQQHIEANVRVQRTRHGLTRFANSFIHQNVGEDTVTLTLTLAVDARTTSASTTSVDHASLVAMVDTAIASASLQPIDPYWPGATPPADVEGLGNVDGATATADPDARAQRVDAFVNAGGPGLEAAGYVDTELDQVAFASTAGHRTSGATTRATVDGIHQTETSAGSGHGTAVSLEALDAATIGATAADRARRSQDFIDIEPGTYEVVLGPDAVATVMTFLAFYGFNGKSFLEGSSFAEPGVQQFDSAITIVEDPSDPRSIGLPFDAEGSARRPFSLVEAGVTRNLAHDRRTAARANTETTGNALAGGESFGAIPTSVALRPGDTSVEQMIASVGRGLLITTFHYVRILDPKSQVATGLTRNGTFLIEDGQVVGAVGNLRFTQSFVDALTPGAVQAVGNDDRYADGEFGPGMVICPSIQLAKWTFTGGAQG